MSDADQAAADLRRRNELEAISTRTPDQEAELQGLYQTIAAREQGAGKNSAKPKAGSEAVPTKEAADASAVAKDAAARQEHLAELGGYAGRWAAAADLTGQAAIDAANVSLSVAKDATAAEDMATAAVAAAEAAKAAGTSDAAAKADLATFATAKAAAMADAASKAATAAMAATTYDTAAKDAAAKTEAARAAFAAWDMAAIAGTPDAAAKEVAAKTAEAALKGSMDQAEAANEAALKTADERDAALSAAQYPAMSTLPGKHQGAFEELRDWVRREIALAHAGHSEETRRRENP